MDHSLKNPQTTPIIYKLYTTQEKSHWELTYVLYEKMTLECKKGHINLTRKGLKHQLHHM